MATRRGPGHPHMRGDYFCVSPSCARLCGPSPHAWGLHKPHPTGVGLPRAIPTCVGTTFSWSPPGPPWPGHPHMRGDYSRLFRRVDPLAGPSPHAWGVPLWICAGCGLGRAIPTCVGTTSARSTPASSWAGHPHMRGDYRGATLDGFPEGGPSPHAWGLQPPPGGPGRGGGPSPHAWGLLVYTPTQGGGWEAIPTCVGTTSHLGSKTKPVTGHPHMRGDYWVRQWDPLSQSGPSPHAWGLLVGLGVVLLVVRAIPTCVGTTWSGWGIR